MSVKVTAIPCRSSLLVKRRDGSVSTMTIEDHICLAWRRLFNIDIGAVRRRDSRIPKSIKPLKAHLAMLENYQNKKRAGAATPAQVKEIDREATERPVAIFSTRTITHKRLERNLKMKLSDAFPAKYIKVADLKGRRLVVTIESVSQEVIGEDEKLIAYFEEPKVKPLVLNRTNASMIEEITGCDQTDDWVGTKIILYPTRVDFQGKRVDAIRVDAPKHTSREPGEDDNGQAVA